MSESLVIIDTNFFYVIHTFPIAQSAGNYTVNVIKMSSIMATKKAYIVYLR